MTRVAHVFDSRIMKRVGAGNWKDITGRRLVLESLDVELEQIPLASVEGSLSRFAHFSDVVWEYTRNPLLIKKVRQANPDIRIHVRAHNAEPLQEFHRTNFRSADLKEHIAAIRRVFGAFREDLRSVSASDSLLSISPWDNDHYWKRFVPTNKLELLCYFCPWPYLPNQAAPYQWAERQDIILAMPGGRDKIGSDIVRNFARIASHNHELARENRYIFALTQGVRGLAGGAPDTPQIGPVKPIHVSDPWQALCEAKAVVVPTNLGFGLKTTIVDGIAAGCHVAVEKTIRERLPSSISDNCLEIDVQDPASFRPVIDAMHEPPRHKGMNEELWDDAQKVMKKLILQDA